MFAKSYCRSGVFAWSPADVPVQGLILGDSAQQFSVAFNAATTAPRLDFIPTSSLYDSASAKCLPSTVVNTEFKLGSLAWSKAGQSEQRPFGLCFAGCENGGVVVFDPAPFINGGRLDQLLHRRDHQGHVLAVDVSADCEWALSGGGSGQLLLWQLANLAQPFSPGQPNFPDQVKGVKWSRRMAQIASSHSTHRCSIWDMRRAGAPVMDIAEIGGGCDWSDFCWSPLEDTTLLIASQADSLPTIMKWDLRYPTAPVREHRVHAKGITAIDWHPADHRLLVSASHDGSLLFSNPETSEVLGHVPVIHNDWVRRVRWSAHNPDLLAVEYFQNNVQISSLQAFAAPSQVEEGDGGVSLAPVELSVVPAWKSAPPTGISFAFGGRHVVYGRKRNDATGAYTYNVEIRRTEGDPELQNSALEFQTAFDNRDLASFAVDKANAAEKEAEQLAWTLLSAAVSGCRRSESIRILGFGDTAEKTSSSVESRINGVSESEADTYENDDQILARSLGRSSLPSVDTSRFDASEWSVVDSLIAGDTRSVVRSLIERGELVAAFAMAGSDNSLRREVVAAQLRSGGSSPLSQLLLYSWSGCFSSLISSLPSSEWRRLLGLLLSQDEDAADHLVVLAEKLSRELDPNECDKETIYRCCLPAILSGDADLLLKTNRGLLTEERLQQALLLRVGHEEGEMTREGEEKQKEWETLLEEHAATLAANGNIDLAWRLIQDEKRIYSPSLLELRHVLWEACGGHSQTRQREPSHPWNEVQVAVAKAYARGGGAGQQQRMAQPAERSAPSSQQWSRPQYQEPSRPGYPPLPQSAHLPPPPSHHLPPSSASYCRADHLPPPPIQPPLPNLAPLTLSNSYVSSSSSSSQYMSQAPNYHQRAPPPGPPIPPASLHHHSAPTMTPPPVPPAYNAYQGGALPQGQNSSSGQSGWNDPPPLSGRRSSESKPAPVVAQVPWVPSDPLPAAWQGVPSATPPQSGRSSVAGSNAAVPVSYQLRPADEYLMSKLQQLEAAIAAASRSPQSAAKARDAMDRLRTELSPRLAAKKLSGMSRSLLERSVDEASHGDVWSAKTTLTALVSQGGDFVEVSPFLPALKNLFSLAQTAFR